MSARLYLPKSASDCWLHCGDTSVGGQSTSRLHTLGGATRAHGEILLEGRSGELTAFASIGTADMRMKSSLQGTSHCSYASALASTYLSRRRNITLALGIHRSTFAEVYLLNETTCAWDDFMSGVFGVFSRSSSHPDKSKVIDTTNVVRQPCGLQLSPMFDLRRRISRSR